MPDELDLKALRDHVKLAIADFTDSVLPSDHHWIAVGKFTLKQIERVEGCVK